MQRRDLLTPPDDLDLSPGDWTEPSRQQL